jgi:hypothetical protein
MPERLKIKGETPLERNVISWLNSHGADYDSGWKGALKDLMYGGCQSGMVGHLIYYTDTVKFYKKHQKEIDALLKEAFDSTGYTSPKDLFGDKWDDSDPLAREDINQNLLAWFGFEETARNIARKAGVEDY